MNPIYKFTLAADGGTEQSANPIYSSDLAKSYEQESNQQFFRAKLSGKLTFVNADYTFIQSQDFDTQFGIKIYISYDRGNTWALYWTGQFWKTDCEFDIDDKYCVVTPTVWDEYVNVIAGLDKEYNLIELAPEIKRVRVDKRPMIQVYIPGQTVIGCFLSGMYWEQECKAITNTAQLVNTYHFALNREELILDITTGVVGVPDVFYDAKPSDLDSNYEIVNGDWKFIYQKLSSSSGVTRIWGIINTVTNQQWAYQIVNQNLPNIPYSITLQAVTGTGASGTIKIDFSDIAVYCRYVCDVLKIGLTNTYQIPTNDITANNRNYTRVVGWLFPQSIFFADLLTQTPTQWGLYEPGIYYQQPQIPAVLGGGEVFPVTRNAWGRLSVWFLFGPYDWLTEQKARAEFTLNDAYPIASVISVLLAKVAPGITHEATAAYSEFLYGTTNPISYIKQYLCITPKSNLLNAGYDQPAQKAPITLNQIFTMLRDCFRCYWFIEDGKLRIEHIKYFNKGGTYTGTPVIGHDLTKEIVTRNGKKWAFATSKYKYEKPEMPARYQFGWMDDVTRLFEGEPINIISKYVNPDYIDEINISNFTSDVDYMLLNPSEISQDGFVLLGAIRPNYITPDTSTHSTLPIYRITVPWTIGETIYIEAEINGVAGSNMAISFYDSSNNLISVISTRTLIGQAQQISLGPVVVPEDATQLGFSSTNVGAVKLGFVGGELKLPYYNFAINGVDHILQNAYVAFAWLQQYYLWDLPARYYSINGETSQANGIKKQKTQTFNFPALTDPNMFQLIKTNLGNGMIQKLSVTLSSRKANATLKYDTE